MLPGMGPLAEREATSGYQGRKRTARRVLIWVALMFLVFVELSAFRITPPGLRPALPEFEVFYALGTGCAVYVGIRDATAAWQLELTRDVLRWRSMFRGGEIPLAELRVVRSRWDGFPVIESAGRRPLLVDIDVRALRRFAADLDKAAPQIILKLPEPRSPRRG
jgi:hypothetical protein